MVDLVILVRSGFLYGSFCECVFGPDDRETLTYTKQGGVDYVPMPIWKNALVNLPNITGTGPIFGPIQGILFGPIAFITIPIDNVISGAVHDYLTGMTCTRDDGIQVSDMVKRYTGKTVFWIYDVFVRVLLLLINTVFIYTPGDAMAAQVLSFSGSVTDLKAWIIYGVIFVCYYVATVFPIDKVIDRIYLIFGAVLVFSAVGVFGTMLTFHYPILNVWDSQNTSTFAYGGYFLGRGEMAVLSHFAPIFFVTVTYGILSGFHPTQTALTVRVLKNEREGRTTFYNMMIVEGFIVTIWVVGTMALIQIGAADGGPTMKSDGRMLKHLQQLPNGSMKAISASSMVGVLCRKVFEPVDDAIALAGAIMLPVTSGDTTFRVLHLIIVDTFHTKQSNNVRRLVLATPIFALVLDIPVWLKVGADGFNQPWRYFARLNRTTAVFASAAAMIYLLVKNKGVHVWMLLVPDIFYTVACGSYILNAKIGLNLPWNAAYIGSILLAVPYTVAIFV